MRNSNLNTHLFSAARGLDPTPQPTVTGKLTRRCKNRGLKTAADLSQKTLSTISLTFHFPSEVSLPLWTIYQRQQMPETRRQWGRHVRDGLAPYKQPRRSLQRSRAVRTGHHGHRSLSGWPGVGAHSPARDAHPEVAGKMYLPRTPPLGAKCRKSSCLFLPF